MTTFITPKGNEFDWDAILNMMDDDIREIVHNDLAPCEMSEFFAAYCRGHLAHHGEEFEFAKDNPTV